MSSENSSENLITHIAINGEIPISDADLPLRSLTSSGSRDANTNGSSEDIIDATGVSALLETARPALTLQQAASLLGKSMRALERSLLGRWGNKLPDGWSAKKIQIGSTEEWRIIPPPGFRVKSNSQNTEKTAYEIFNAQTSFSKSETFSGERLGGEPGRESGKYSGGHSGILGGSSNGLTASRDIFGELSALSKRTIFRSEQSVDTQTIVIDRSDEVEQLLRELLCAQKELSEERRLHMDDLRTLAQVQSNMRLLEDSAAEKERAKKELESSQRELEALKQEYTELLNMPWWKRLFASTHRTENNC